MGFQKHHYYCQFRVTEFYELKLGTYSTNIVCSILIFSFPSKNSSHARPMVKDTKKRHAVAIQGSIINVQRYYMKSTEKIHSIKQHGVGIHKYRHKQCVPHFRTSSIS